MEVECSIGTNKGQVLRFWNKSTCVILSLTSDNNSMEIIPKGLNMDNAAALIIDSKNNVSEPQLYGTLRMHAVYNVHTGWKLLIHTACLP